MSIELLAVTSRPLEIWTPTQVEVVISELDMGILQAHLLQNELEQHAFLLTGVCRGHRGTRLMVREMVLAGPEDFAEQTPHYIELRPTYFLPVLDRCREERMGVIEAHSHPFCRQGVTFSDTDTANEREKFAWYGERLPTMTAATLVFGQESVDGHWYENGAIRPMDGLRVVGRGMSYRAMTSCSRRDGASALDHAPFHRQELAFGAEGQERVAKTRVGLVGCGGLGSIMAEMLAHTGVIDWVLVDFDTVDRTSLNRMAFARPEDATVGRLKVDVVARGIREIQPDARVQCVPLSIDGAEARSALREVDVLLSGPDNDGARMLANELSLAYLIPLFDLGTGINIKDGEVTDAGGQVVMARLGEGCMYCRGTFDPERARLDLMNRHERDRHIARGYGTATAQPSVMFLNATVAALAVGEFLKFVTGLRPAKAMLLYDALGASVVPVTPAQPDPRCPACHRSGLYGRGDQPENNLFTRHAPDVGSSVPESRGRNDNVA